MESNSANYIYCALLQNNGMTQMDRILVLRVRVHASQQEVYSKVGNQDGKE